MSRSKKPSLAKAMKQAAEPAQSPIPIPTSQPQPVPENPKSDLPEKKAKAVTGRDGLKPVQGYFHPEVRKHLKRLAAEEDSNVQELLREALNDFFEKRGIGIRA